MEKRKIKLLLVSSVFVDRGAERLMISLYRLLPKDIYEIKILCLRNLAPYADYINKSSDIKIDIIGMKSNIDFVSLFRFYQYLKTYKPDIINFHHFRAALWGRPLAKLAKAPLVLYSVHNKWGGAIHHFLDRLMSTFSDAIIPFSQSVRNYLINTEKIKEKKIEKPIYAGIETSKFSNIKQNEIDALKKELRGLGIQKKHHIIGFIGNITKEKGLVYLIESIRCLKRKFDNICCLLIGEGPDEAYLKKLISDYGLSDNFIFLGTRYDIPNLLNIMDIFVLPSLREGLPLVVIEAFAACCPVIATNIDGIPEIVMHNKNGLLVPPANVTELAEAIETLLTSEKLRKEFATNGYKTAIEKFDIKKMVESYDRLYQDYFNRHL